MGNFSKAVVYIITLQVGAIEQIPALNINLPGYGILPYVTISVSKIPNDHTSDLIVNRL